mmetsp:Transcript_3540/g.6312  ORF Transcript_3540/g.6312 Transcript_3540/m.6312 type:complete len:336 (-) Transcript_3540:88-1095(-)
MNSWAAAGKYDCNFLCVCVLGDQSAISLSREMGMRMKLSHCINAFVDNDAGMPDYGQLGCNGFIVLDGSHRVLSRQTSSFNQVKGLAFKHVEALVSAACAKLPPPAVCPGEMVQIVEAPAKVPQLRGQQGFCTDQLDADTLAVVLVAGPYRGKVIKVSSATVRKLAPEEEEDDEESGGGCGTGGGCDKDGCNSGSCDNGTVDDGFVDAALDLASVQVPSMDDEHEECAVALRRLATERSASSLQLALQCIAEHFEHEEALFEEYGFGGHVNDRFSAKKSHIEDHRRMTRKIEEQLARGSKTVPSDIIREVLQDFHDHANKFDASYAEFLSSKGAR